MKSEMLEVLERICREVHGEGRKEEKMLRVCQILQESFERYNWVGIYYASGDELLLGPFVGEPTEHTRIKFGQGICGQAAERRETFVVQDVSKEENYLSCSPKVKSEIVVPIFKDGEIVGELDIDSHRLSPFTREDEEFLKEVCKILSHLF